MNSLFVATPCRDGMVAAPYATAMWALARDPGIDSLEIHLREGDLVRIRSRMVREFLASKASHLLFVDSDVAFDRRAIAGMLASGHDLVCCPYPHKRIHWDRVAESGPVAAYSYPVTLGEAARSDTRGCVEVSAVPMGCTLLSRAMLQMMTEHYAPSLTFDDKGEPTVALFQLVLDREKGLLSEDYSACHRWVGLGGQCHLYVGLGAPASHVGTYLFEGSREGLVREAP